MVTRCSKESCEICSPSKKHLREPFSKQILSKVCYECWSANNLDSTLNYMYDSSTKIVSETSIDLNSVLKNW